MSSGQPPGEAGEGLGALEDLLREEAVWATPPASVESAVLSRVSGRPVEEGPTTAPRRRRRWTVAAALGASAAAVLVLLGVALWGGPEPVPETLVALSGTEEEPALWGTATVRNAEAGWYVRLHLPGLPPAPEGTYYQGWVRRDENAVSIGTFHMRGDDDSVVLWSGVSLHDYPALEVTLQVEGAGVSPSERVVLAGRMPSP